MLLSLLFAVAIAVVAGEHNRDDFLRNLLGSEEFTSYQCDTGRSRLHSGLSTKIQGACRECLKGNNTVFILRGLSQEFSACHDQSMYPRRSLGRWYAQYWSCDLKDCGHPYIPIMYRADDINCQKGNNLKIPGYN